MSRKVKVRIAVAVGYDGKHWLCDGQFKQSDQRTIANVQEWFHDAFHHESNAIVWVEAEIPVPEPETVLGVPVKVDLRAPERGEGG